METNPPTDPVGGAQRIRADRRPKNEASLHAYSTSNTNHKARGCIMHVERVKDVIARWQSYRDRGVKPKLGWGDGPDGRSCALGDAAHYAGMRFDGEERTRLGKKWKGKVGTMFGLCQYRELEVGEYLGLTAQQTISLYDHNDRYGEWPIEPLRKMLNVYEMSAQGPSPAPLDTTPEPASVPASLGVSD